MIFIRFTVLISSAVISPSNSERPDIGKSLECAQLNRDPELALTSFILH